jgi:UDP-N-acetylglucosamine 2-epimerase (non-hydrolysing)
MIAPLARWHFAPTAGAAANLMAEGIDPARIFRTGNTVIDALAMAQAMLRSNPAFGSGAEALLNRFAGKPFALATVHRREHDGDDLRGIGRALRTLGERIGIVLPAHPRPESRLLLEVIGDHPAVAVVPPLDYLPFLRILDRSRLVLTDSGGVQEEATALGRPVLVLRSVTERGEAVTAGTARLVGSNPAAIIRAAEEVLAENRSPQPDNVFGDGQASRRIADVLTA